MASKLLEDRIFQIYRDDKFLDNVIDSPIPNSLLGFLNENNIIPYLFRNSLSEKLVLPESDRRSAVFPPKVDLAFDKQSQDYSPVSAVRVTSRDKDLEREAKQRSLHLNALQSVVDREYGEGVYDVKKGFTSVSSSTNDFRTDPIIVPSDQLRFGHKRNLGGLEFTFWFAHKNTNQSTINVAVLGIDRSVIHELSELRDAGSSLPKSILKDIRDFFALAGHDFIHQLQFADPSEDFSTEDKAAVMQGAIWEDITNSKPKVINAIAKRGENFLDKINKLRNEMIYRFGDEDRANKVAAYLAIIGMTQLDIMLDLESPRCSKIMEAVDGSAFKFVAPNYKHIDEIYDLLELGIKPLIPAPEDVPKILDRTDIVKYVRNSVGLASSRLKNLKDRSVKEALTSIQTQLERAKSS